MQSSERLERAQFLPEVFFFFGFYWNAVDLLHYITVRYNDLLFAQIMKESPC